MKNIPENDFNLWKKILFNAIIICFRVFLEMLYGFTTGYGSCMVAQAQDTQRKDSIGGSAKSSNYLQVC